MATIEQTEIDSIGLVPDSGLPIWLRDWIKLLPVSEAVWEEIIEASVAVEHKKEEYKSLHLNDEEMAEVLDSMVDDAMRKQLFWAPFLILSVVPFGLHQLPFGILKKIGQKTMDSINSREIQY